MMTEKNTIIFLQNNHVGSFDCDRTQIDTPQAP
jgi:hypothetical protein